MKKITIPGAIPPRGHYTPAIESNGFLFLSGIIPANPVTGEKHNAASFGEQTAVVLNNLETVLKAAGSSLQKLVKVTVFLNDISHWDEFNKLYLERMGDHKPARTVVPVGSLHYGFLIELDAIAEI
jgi:2-iminobutanoate/2-iminopropanoate deaminase